MQDSKKMGIEGYLHRIGSVANLTGIAVERLRAWERRYGLEPAHRQGRTRYYSNEQLAQLRHIKQLVDQGFPISSLASLSNEQLMARLAESRTSVAHSPRVGLIGPNLTLLAHQQEAGSRLEVVAQWMNMTAFAADGSTPPALDVLIAQVPVLTMQPVEQIRKKYPEIRIIMAYQFAADKYLQRVADLSIELLSWPMDWRELEIACATGPQRAPSEAKRRFTDAELVAIAASSTDPSKCPQHLVELISQLNAFADYMLNCVSADEATAAHAALYGDAHTECAEARRRLEAALETFVEATN